MDPKIQVSLQRERKSERESEDRAALPRSPGILDALCCQVCKAEIRDEKGFPDFERRFCSERANPQCMKTYRTWMMRTKRAKDRVEEFTVRFGAGYIAKVYTKERAEALQEAIAEYEQRWGPVKVKAKTASGD